ncbi:MAG TPA: carbonic anhydrase [Thermodesulfovibrionia bacterium]|nr:carbonic anhydrase [Thermodesulfovibrionia bacterium]
MKKAVSIMLLMLVFFVFPGMSEAKEEHGHALHWGYTGEAGPEHWGKLAQEYGVCSEGKGQSPVDIQGAYKADLKPFQVDYKEAPLRIINNGHTIQVNFDAGSSVTIDDQKYELAQFHFHTPSEHKVVGKVYAGELHLVHKGKEGALAVVGVFLEKGEPNKAIQALLDNLPETVNQERGIRGINVNASELLPKDLGFYRYFGSLTTPPCSEIILWTVLKNPVQVSEEQLQKLSKVMGENARPVNPIGRRYILESQ